jgi:hypothetical protein
MEAGRGLERGDGETLHRRAHHAAESRSLTPSHAGIDKAAARLDYVHTSVVRRRLGTGQRGQPHAYADRRALMGMKRLITPTVCIVHICMYIQDVPTWVGVGISGSTRPPASRACGTWFISYLCISIINDDIMRLQSTLPALCRRRSHRLKGTHPVRCAPSRRFILTAYLSRGSLAVRVVHMWACLSAGHLHIPPNFT